MKRILVPTDFSEAAGGAFRYAQHLARQREATLTLLHVYHPAYDLDNPYLDVPAKDYGDLRQRSLKNFLAEYMLNNDGEPAPAIQTQLAVGFAGEEIARRAESADLVVMGTTGEAGRLEHWLGSVSTYVARHCRRPVLLVPGESAFRPVRRLMYASDNNPGDEDNLQRLVHHLRLEPHLIHHVHIEIENDECSYRIVETRVKQVLQNQGEPLDLQFVRVQCENILEGLYQYSQENRIDLIVMGTVYRNFLKGLFHQSVTRQMIYRTNIPLLIFHYE